MRPGSLIVSHDVLTNLTILRLKMIMNQPALFELHFEGGEYGLRRHLPAYTGSFLAAILTSRAIITGLVQASNNPAVHLEATWY